MVSQVNFFARRADVLYDPTQVTVEQMAQALSRYGYRASPMDDARPGMASPATPQR